MYMYMLHFDRVKWYCAANRIEDMVIILYKTVILKWQRNKAIFFQNKELKWEENYCILH